MESGQSLMIEDFGSLSLVESEMESQGGNKCGNSDIEHHVGPVSVTVGIEGIVSKLIAVGFVVGIGLVNNQVSVRVWGENVLVTIEISEKC